jgi:hypothetical protein
LMIFSRFHTLCGHEILWTYTYLTQEQEFEVPRSIPTLKNGFLGLQNSDVPLSTGKKTF